MGRRNTVTKYQVWTNQDSAVPAASVSTIVDQLDIIKYVIVCAASVVGVLTVQFTDDKMGTEVWRDLDFDQVLTINGATETQYTVKIEKHVCHKLRLNFTNGGGAGLINAWFSASQVGA